MPKILQIKSFHVNSRNLAHTHFMTSREPSKDDVDEIPNLSHTSSEKLILSENDEEKTKFRARPTVQVHT
jgi:hypothetical protein